MFKVDPVEKERFLAALKKRQTEINKEVLDVFKGFVTVAYSMVVDETPQWTGHAAAQWNIGINHIDVARSHLFLKDHLAMSRAVKGKYDGPIEPKRKGHSAAVEEAKRRQSGFIQQIRLADIIFISNNVEDLLTGAYARKLEENPNNYLRDENGPDPGHMIAKTLGWFNSRVAVLTPAERLKFKVAKLSDTGFMERF